ncbi:hypothetical protein TYRP_015204 [Tyrophagus putrescentiae]|nr:hypothetical protein TYRP_015204 [Tyrophagus putrescentiae]
MNGVWLAPPTSAPASASRWRQKPSAEKRNTFSECQSSSSGSPLRPPYNAVVRNEYSYAVLTVVNGSHLRLEQVDEGGARLDEFVMRKDRPRPAWL